MAEEMVLRDAPRYNPILSGLHTVLMLFKHNIEAEEIIFVWANWISEESFNTYGQSINELDQTFYVRGTAYQAFMNTFGEAVTGADNKMKEIFGVRPAFHRLRGYEIDGFQRVMQVDAPPINGELDYITNKRTDVNNAFDITVQANREFLTSIGMACLVFAAGTQPGCFYDLLLKDVQRQLALLPEEEEE